MSSEPKASGQNRFTGSPLVALLGTLARAQELHSIEEIRADFRPGTAASPAETPATGSDSLEPGDAFPIVEALKSIYAAYQANGHGGGSNYEKNHRQFSELATQLKEQSAAAERLASLDQGPALRGRLHLQCQRGRTARGQFRCDNKTGRMVHVDLRARGMRNGTNPCDSADLAVTPKRAWLAAEEGVLFTVEADLARCAEIADAILVASVDLYLDRGLALRLFVCVEVRDGEGEAQTADLDAATPCIALHDIDEATLGVLRSIQDALLKHPIAFQAAFSALIAEGERFEQTRDGKALQKKLAGSALLQQLRYVFDLSTFSMLEREAPGVLPSAYFDTLFMLAASDRSDEILDRLFRELTPK